MRIFFFIDISPQDLLSLALGAFFQRSKISSFEDPPTILHGFLKYFSTAALCFLKCGFCKRISATPTEWLIPPKAPLFGALGEGDYQLKKPLPLAYTTDEWCCQIKKSIYVWQDPEDLSAVFLQTLASVSVILSLGLTLKNKNPS